MIAAALLSGLSGGSADAPHFTDVTPGNGITFRHAASKTSVKFLPETMGGGEALLDYDGDARLDVYFTNGAALGEGMSSARAPDKRAPRSGIVSIEGKALGVAIDDYDGDGRVDVFVANDSMRQFLFRNLGDSTFAEVGVAAGVAFDEDGRTFAGMGTDFGDYDDDGRPDLIVTTLSLERYALFHNDGPGGFTYATHASGVGAATVRHSGWGTRLLDYDNDGDLDVVVGNLDGVPVVLRNESGGRSLRVRLRGSRSNRDGLGAVVVLTDARGRTRRAICSTASSYQSASDPRVHFGLGTSTAVRLDVHWPSGLVQTVSPLPPQGEVLAEKPRTSRPVR